MKSFTSILAALAATTLFFAGCGKTDQPAQIDTSALTQSFASAEATVKTAVENTVSAVKQGNYAGALQQLQKLGANAKLTDDQKKAVTDLIAKVQKAITETVGKAATEAGKAADNATKALTK
ncbi:MAG: hypothetical protein JXQ71_17230 [Verrucomicrobia bacterium]|nr:hypothetical protein [Verrucomicrobiota bacterium]